MNELTIRVPEEMTPEELGNDIRALTRQAKMILLDFGIQIGYRLKLVQEKVEHFAPWVEENTEFSKSAAYRYVKLYEEYGGQTGLFGVENIFPTLGKLSISNALRLLEVPEEEREEFAKSVDAENISARELERAIAEKKAAEDAAAAALSEKKRMEKDLSTARDERDALRRENKSLRERPVEVAVQEPTEEQIRAAADKLILAERKELEKEWTETYDDLAKAKESAEKEAERLRGELEKNMKALKQNAEADAGKQQELEDNLSAMAEELRKAMLKSRIATANALAQQGARMMQEAAATVQTIEDAATREKVREAMRKMLQAVENAL